MDANEAWAIADAQGGPGVRRVRSGARSSASRCLVLGVVVVVLGLVITPLMIIFGAVLIVVGLAMVPRAVSRHRMAQRMARRPN